MVVRLSEGSVEVRLATWEKILGLMGNMSFPRADVHDVRLVGDGVRAAMKAPGLKAGLRLPWWMYVCRSLRLDEAWVVRKGVPALSFSIAGHGNLRRVTVSSPDAAALVAQLQADAPPG